MDSSFENNNSNINKKKKLPFFRLALIKSRLAETRVLLVEEINGDTLTRTAADRNSVDTSGVKPFFGMTRCLPHQL